MKTKKKKGVFDVQRAAKRRHLARRKSVAFVSVAERAERRLGLYQVDAPEDDYWPSSRNDVSEKPTADAPHVYILATDGYRVHVALLPPEIAADVDAEPYLQAAAPDVQAVVRACENTNPPAVGVNADYLKEAIHPDAYTVVITSNGTGPLEVFSLMEDGTQVGYAAVMPSVPANNPWPVRRPHLPYRFPPPPLPASLRPVKELWEDIEELQEAHEEEIEAAFDDREFSPIEVAA